MKDYLYRDRLLSGRGEVPSKHSWWPRHSALMTRYLILATTKNSLEIRRARDLVTVTATEWDRMAKGAGERQKSGRGCMSDHAALERNLVDASLRKDTVSVGKIMKAIEKNSVDQSLIYGMSYPGFPELSFCKLQKEHLDLFFESTKAYLDGNMRGFDESELQRKTNTLALVELTAEWF